MPALLQPINHSRNRQLNERETLAHAEKLTKTPQELYLRHHRNSIQYMVTTSIFRGLWMRTLWKESDAPELTQSPPLTQNEDGMYTVDEFPSNSSLLKSFALWLQSPPLTHVSGDAHPSLQEEEIETSFFADVRCVPHIAGKFGQRRFFCGSLEVTQVSDEEQKLANKLFFNGIGKNLAVEIERAGGLQFSTPSCRLTWHRHVDSLPESCPSGIDSAMCFLVPPKKWLEKRIANCKNEPFCVSWDDLVAMEENVNMAEDGERWKIVEAGDGYWEEWERISFWHNTSDKTKKTEGSTLKASARVKLDPRTAKLEGLDFSFFENKSGLEEIVGELTKGRISVSKAEPALIQLNFVDKALVDPMN